MTKISEMLQEIFYNVGCGGIVSLEIINDIKGSGVILTKDEEEIIRILEILLDKINGSKKISCDLDISVIKPTEDSIHELWSNFRASLSSRMSDTFPLQENLVELSELHPIINKEHNSFDDNEKETVSLNFRLFC